MQNYIPLSVPNFDKSEVEYTKTAIETEWVSTAGPYIPKFEKAISSYVGSEDCAVCQNGTSALHLAYMEVGISRDDLVIVPNLTFIASINPLMYIGAIPVFMDCDEYLCIDPEKIEEFCSEECELREGELFHKASNRRVKAIVPVHIFGNLCDMDRIVCLAERFNLKIVEDACESLGSFFVGGRFDGKHSGMVGDIGVFSFNGNKIITTGGGGAVVAREQKSLDHIRYLSQQSKDDALRFIHNEVGYNYRMTNVQAALGLAQIEKLESFVSIKENNYNAYIEKGLPLLPFATHRCRPNRWFYSLFTDNKRDEVIGILKENGIESRPIWELMHRLKPFTPFGNISKQNFEKSSYFHKNIVNIPCSTNLKEEELLRVAETLKAVLLF
ncbi:MAG: LegC family aminotransferase [Ruminococcaceae bacterium]|nr:LegC family aminotransferase [Oscillospiraceae bacterium]